MRRLLLLIPFFLFAANVRATDVISLKFKRFGIEGAYRENQNMVWLEIEAQNNSAQTMSVSIRAFEADLDSFARPASYNYLSRVTLPPSGRQSIDIPLQITNRAKNTVLYAEAVNDSGSPLGHAAQRLQKPTNGRLIGLLCANDAVCKSIRQTILFSGTPEEQTRKAQELHLIQLQQVPPVWWAYADVDTVVIAAPAGNLSREETDALEAFALRGGRIVLAEKEMGGFASAGAPFASDYSPAARKLLTPVGWGTLARVATIGSQDFSNYFRPYGFATSTPAEVVAQYKQYRAPVLSNPQGEFDFWVHNRTKTQFQFPGLLELILWMSGYLLVTVGISFFLLRRLGKPELAWLTIPAIALLFSVVLFKVSARNRPTDYGMEEARYYQLDGDSTLALADSKVQISAPRKGTVRLSAPGSFVYQPGQGYEDYSLVNFLPTSEIQLGKSWESNVFLRVWSANDVSFEFTHRFPGSVSRSGETQLLNSTGVDFDEAMLVTHEGLYLFGPLASGGTADLSRAKMIPYNEIAGHRVNGAGLLASPPFAIGFGAKGPYEDFPAGEWMPQRGAPFSLEEIVRGWPIDADRVFVQTKAIFFGKGKDIVEPATLGETPAQHKSVAVYSVTYRDWK